MADFDVVLVQTVDPARVSYPIWTDPADGEDPTRLNPRGNVQHRYARIGVTAIEAEPTIEFDAVVGGVQAPDDASLGGRRFSWFFGSWPTGAPIPPLTSPVGGKTSRVTFPVRSRWPGHYVLVARRPTGGHICFPFDIEIGLP